jgi:phosphoribosylaminoimidazole-succinocarboxamide synthase
MSAEPPSQASHTGDRLINEGKTKIILEDRSNPDRVLITSKDDITAGDGAKHDLLAGKAAMSTETTSNVFRLLKACGIPVAFDARADEKSFWAPRCTMLPYEVVTRREAHGSYIKRHPSTTKGDLLPALLVEFYLKTNKRRWKEHALPCDDPLIVCDPAEHVVRLYEPSKPLADQASFLVLREEEVFAHPADAELLEEMRAMAIRTFLVLEKAWQIEGGRLADCKVEFGLMRDGTLLLADVIDNDSWRVIEHGGYLDKQVYREGGAMDEVAANYQRVANITSRFQIPEQRLVVLSTAGSGDASMLGSAVARLTAAPVKLETVEIPLGETVPALARRLKQLSHEHPNSVLIVHHAMAGDVSRIVALPVVAVSQPDESELHEAIRTALKILALQNPCLYMQLNFEPESRRE